MKKINSNFHGIDQVHVSHSLHWFWHLFYAQISGASPAIEYVSWLSGFIFTILSIFTVFLAFQFQTNVSESKKVLYRLRECILARQSNNDILALINDFKYYRTPSPAIQMAQRVTHLLLNWLIAIWIFSGMSRALKDGFTENGVVYLGFIIDVLMTVIFVFLAFKLKNILKKISDFDSLMTSGQDKQKSKNTEETEIDISNIEYLKHEGFSLHNIFLVSNIKWIVTLNDIAPLTSIKVFRDVGFHNFSVVLSLRSENQIIYLGAKMPQLSDPHVPYSLSIGQIDQEELNKILSPTNAERRFDKHISFLVDSKWLTFTVNVEVDQHNNDLPKKLLITLDSFCDDETSWAPPNPVEQRLLQSQEIVSVDVIL